MNRCALSGLALLALAAPAFSQAIQRLGGPITPLRLDPDTGRIEPGEFWNPATDAPGTTFANVTTAGFYAAPLFFEEWVDWGVKAGGLTGAVCTVELGYGTMAVDPSLGGPGASVEIAVYAGTLGGCTPGDTAQEKRRFTLSGLPGSLDGSPAGYVLELELDTETFALADGPIGWGYVGKDGVTGPLLVVVGADPTGNVDLFDLYVPAPATTGFCLGSFALGTPGVASFYLRIEEDDGTQPGSQTPRAGSGVNLGVLSPAAVAPKIGQAWQPSITTPAVASPALDFLALSSVAIPPLFLPGFGEILIGITPPNPVLTVGLPTPLGTPFNLNVPFNCSLIGKSVSAQAGQVSSGGVIGLTDALDITFGI